MEMPGKSSLVDEAQGAAFSGGDSLMGILTHHVNLVDFFFNYQIRVSNSVLSLFHRLSLCR